jgi:hypothetical protein
MLHDLEFGPSGTGTPHFFPAVLRDGVIEVPPFEPTGRAEGAR